MDSGELFWTIVKAILFVMFGIPVILFVCAMIIAGIGALAEMVFGGGDR